MHVPRLAESLPGSATASAKRAKAGRLSGQQQQYLLPGADAASAASSAWPSPMAATSVAATPASSTSPNNLQEQRYLAAHARFSQLVSSPPSATPSPSVLPVSLLPFHRAFQADGWRLALATPEDRYSGRHVCTSILALLWLKAPEHVLNHSSERHWIARVRHMVSSRAAASIAGPHSGGLAPGQAPDAQPLPTLSDAAEFSLAHALHLPHTVIYTQDSAVTTAAGGGASGTNARWGLKLSSLPEHVWQRAPPVDAPPSNAADSDPSLRPFDGSVSVRPSVWYFSRHALEGQNEILRKNRPNSLQEHVDMMRAAFLKESSSATKKKQHAAAVRSSTATGCRKRVSSPVRSLASLPLPEQLDSNLAAAQEVVAQYTSLDPQRGTHVGFLTRHDMETFLQRAIAEQQQHPLPQQFQQQQEQSRPKSAATSRAADGSSALSARTRKDRLRQQLYSDLYNEMDIIAPPPSSSTEAPEQKQQQQHVAGIGTRVRPSTASATSSGRGGGGATPAAADDPLSLHPGVAPSVSQFRGRKLVGMLQQFVPPPGAHAEVLRVEWHEEPLARWEGQEVARERRRHAKEARAARRQQRAQARQRRTEESGGGLPTEAQIAAEAAADEEDLAFEAEEVRLRAEEDAQEREAMDQAQEKRSVCYISRRLNAHPLRLANTAAGSNRGAAMSPRDPSLYERVCCFAYSDAAPPVLDSTVMQGVMHTRLSYVCDLIAAHVRAISNYQLAPQRMHLFFQIDAQHELHFLWCDRLIYWHEKALLDGPGREAEVRLAREAEQQKLIERKLRRQRRAEARAQHALVSAAIAGGAKPEDVVSAQPCAPVRLVYSAADAGDYDASFFASLPPPSSNSASMSELLAGRYNKIPKALEHMQVMHSLKDDDPYATTTTSAAANAESDAQEGDPATKTGTGSQQQQQKPRVYLKASKFVTSRNSSSDDSDEEEEEERQKNNKEEGDAKFAEPDAAAAETVSDAALPPPTTTSTEELATTQPFIVNVEPPSPAPVPNVDGVDETTSADATQLHPSSQLPRARSKSHSHSQSSSLVPAGVATGDGSSAAVASGAADDSSDDEAAEPVDGLTALLQQQQKAAVAGSSGTGGGEESSSAVPHSDWANEVLFEFARKRAQERKAFRLAEQAHADERAAKIAAKRGGALLLAPTSALQAAAAVAAGSPLSLSSRGGGASKGGKKGSQELQQGFNLLEAGLSGALPAHMTAARSRGEVSSGAAFLLAKAQRAQGLGGGGSSSSSAAITGAKGIRHHLSALGVLELQPSATPSPWETRGQQARYHHYQASPSMTATATSSSPVEQQHKEKQQESKTNHTSSMFTATANYRMRQVDRLAAATSPSLSAGSACVVRDDEGASQFGQRMRAELDLAARGAAQPLAASTTLDALAASMHGANARGLAHSASSSSGCSFAPPPVPPHLRDEALASAEQAAEDAQEEEERLESDEEEAAVQRLAVATTVAADDEDNTFLTSTALSPRVLSQRARQPKPVRPPPVGGASLPPSSSSVSLAPPSLGTAVAAAGAVGGTSAPVGYFTCPKCRLSLQIHAVHSTLVADVLAEFERMAALMDEHADSFARQLAHRECSRTAAGKNKGPRQNAPAHYMDLSVYGAAAMSVHAQRAAAEAGESAEKVAATAAATAVIPPALAFVFPTLSPASFAALRTDPTFLRSTIDLCGDCHALVRVPLHRGSGEEQMELTPLILTAKDEPQKHGRAQQREQKQQQQQRSTGGGAGADNSISNNSPMARSSSSSSSSSSSAFLNLNLESRVLGLSHASTLQRQALRALDEEVETAAYVDSVQHHEHSGGGGGAGADFVPLDVRRLNQSTLDLLAHIPYNAIEIAEFEAARAAEEAREAERSGVRTRPQSAVGARSSRAAAVAEILERHARGRQQQQKPRASSPSSAQRLSAKRIGIQQQLLLTAGITAPPPPPAVPQRHSHPEAMVGFSGNPFMPPRREPTPASPTATTAAVATGSPHVLQRNGSTASFVQSERRRAHTAQIIQDVVAQVDSPLKQTTTTTTSKGGRADQHVEGEQGEEEGGSAVGRTAFGSAAPVSDKGRRPPSAYVVRDTSVFAPLFQQLTRGKPLARPVDHVALGLEAKHLEQRQRARFSSHVAPLRARPDAEVPLGFVPIQQSPATAKNAALAALRAGAGSTPAASQPPRRQQQQQQLGSAPSSSSVSATVAAGTAHAVLSPLSSAYAVHAPSPYLPHLLSVANTHGHIPPNPALYNPLPTM